jgi:hypothetical protein
MGDLATVQVIPQGFYIVHLLYTGNGTAFKESQNDHCVRYCPSETLFLPGLPFLRTAPLTAPSGHLAEYRNGEIHVTPSTTGWRTPPEWRTLPRPHLF